MDRLEWISAAVAAVAVPLLCIAAFAVGRSANSDSRAAVPVHAQAGAIHQQAQRAGVVPRVVAPPAPAPPALAAALGASKPVRLSIPAIGVDTSLIPLGLLRDGSLAVPPDGLEAGWYTGAPTPGELGPAVIAGHVDWHGPAVFHDLGRLKVGALVTVGRADHSVVTFVVTKVGQYAKDNFPTAAVYGNSDFPGLRLITCGGVFDKSTGHYVDNVVVFAKLVAYTPGA
jgi:hypothetical protein